MLTYQVKEENQQNSKAVIIEKSLSPRQAGVNSRARRASSNAESTADF